MIRPKVDAGPAAEFAPAGETLTDYDRLHLITYLMLLDAVRMARHAPTARARSCGSTPTGSRNARGMPMTAISPVPAG